MHKYFDLGDWQECVCSFPYSIFPSLPLSTYLSCFKGSDVGRCQTDFGEIYYTEIFSVLGVLQVLLLDFMRYSLCRVQLLREVAMYVVSVPKQPNVKGIYFITLK